MHNARELDKYLFQHNISLNKYVEEKLIKTPINIYFISCIYFARVFAQFLLGLYPIFLYIRLATKILNLKLSGISLIE